MGGEVKNRKRHKVKKSSKIFIIPKRPKAETEWIAVRCGGKLK